MNKLAMTSGLWASLLLCSAGCQREGLTSSGTGGNGGGLSRGGAGGGSLGTGGASGTSGAISSGGLPGTGGIAGTGGVVGQGGGSSRDGAAGSGGAVGTDGAVSTGGIRGTGGALGSGGSRGTGGLMVDGGGTGLGGVSGTGGRPASGGTPGTGGVVATGGVKGTGGAGASPGTGGTTSNTCGGIAGLICPAGQFCDLPAGDCGHIPDSTGTCVATGGMVCPANYAPVCGCDGKTYGNDCERQAAGALKASQGECPTSTSACPADISQITSWPCTEGLTCEYGTDPRPGCRASATCSNGTWSLTKPDCAQLPPVTCPATREAAAGQLCPTDGAYCVYGDLSCACTNCTDGPVAGCGGDLTWHCAAPNADAACPAGIPLLGSACTTDGKTCTYACGPGNARTCKSGAWYSADGGPCPISTRRAKKNIVYLSQVERQRVADKLARFKLATYEYRDPALAGKRHLGFIIEDVPGSSPAVARDGNMVDLYGYASMLVAAVQAQGQEIAKLKAELARLKRQTPSK